MDVFVKVFEKLETFDDTKSALSTWIYNITRNTLIDYYRTRKVHEELPEQIPTHLSIEDEIVTDDELSRLADALTKLDSRERNIIVLRYYENMTLKDIADKIGVSYSYIKILHNDALEKLKKML